LRTLGTMITLLVLWLLMSGIYEPMLIGFGVVSVVLVLIVTKRMDAQDDDQIEIRLSPIRFARYLLWLMMEIARANWAVTKIVLSRKMPIRQHLFAVPYTQKTDVGQVIFANSITLTPGTITVETEGGHFLVHAVAYSAEDPAALADMCARVTETETTGSS